MECRYIINLLFCQELFIALVNTLVICWNQQYNDVVIVPDNYNLLSNHLRPATPRSPISNISVAASRAALEYNRIIGQSFRSGLRALVECLLPAGEFEGFPHNVSSLFDMR